MAITVAAIVSGVLDPNERIVAIQTIVRANKLRVQQLPFDTGPNIKTSYETLLSEGVVSAHLANTSSAVDQTGLELAGVSEDQRTRVRKFIISAVQSGKSPEAVIAAIEAAKP